MKRTGAPKGEKLTDGRILPIDQVEVKWTKSPFHKKDATSMIHRALAEKLSKEGKCEIVKGGKEEVREVAKIEEE